MYSDSIKVANKIITYDDLLDIFSKMQEKLVHYKKINDSEEMKNRMLDYSYQNWSFKDGGSKLHFQVNFYDDTEIKFDNYNNFIAVFNSRLDEIKYIYVYFSLNYSIQPEGGKSEYYNQSISMYIYENKMEINISLSSNDKKIDDVYELIKRKVLNAKPKYDEVIKKKSLINAIVSFGVGLIPSLVIATVLIFIPSVRQIYSSGYIVYPIVCLFLSFIIGGSIASNILDKNYLSISPEKKYAGYDENKGKSVYKDDIDKYITTSEILIGKNMNNLECRKEIIAAKDKYKKWLPYEFGLMIIISIVVLFLG